MSSPAVRIALAAVFSGAAPLSAQVSAPLPETHRLISGISVPVLRTAPAAGIAPVARAGLARTVARADGYPTHHSPALLEMAQDSSVGTGPLIFGGIIGGGLGMVLGAAAGAGLEVLLTTECIDYCGLGGGIIGAGVGESLGMAFGVHTANDRRGSFTAAVVGPLAILATSLLVGGLLEDVSVPPIIVAVGVPVVQLATSIGAERGAEKRKREARN